VAKISRFPVGIGKYLRTITTTGACVPSKARRTLASHSPCFASDFRRHAPQFLTHQLDASGSRFARDNIHLDSSRLKAKSVIHTGGGPLDDALLPRKPRSLTAESSGGRGYRGRMGPGRNEPDRVATLRVRQAGLRKGVARSGSCRSARIVS